MHFLQINPLTVNILGYTAAFFGTILMLPQAYKTYRTKHVDDISLIMLIVYILNCTLWGIYGLFLQSGPMLICNGISLVIGFLMLAMKLTYSKSGKIQSSRH
jgi:MtN3 and saliva related transmembrane protein